MAGAGKGQVRPGPEQPASPCRTAGQSASPTAPSGRGASCVTHRAKARVSVPERSEGVTLGAACARAPRTPPRRPALARPCVTCRRLTSDPHLCAGALSASVAGAEQVQVTRAPTSLAPARRARRSCNKTVCRRAQRLRGGGGAGTRSTSRRRRRARRSRPCWASGCAARCCGSRRASWRGARRGLPGTLAARLWHPEHVLCIRAVRGRGCNNSLSQQPWAPGGQVRRALTACCAGRGGAGGAGARARGRGRVACGAAAARGRGRPRRRGRQCAHLPADHGGARRLGAGKSRVVQGLGHGSLGPLARAPRRRCPAGERGSQRVSFLRGSSAAAVCATAAGRGSRRPSCASMPCVHVPGGSAAGRRGIDNMPLFRSVPHTLAPGAGVPGTRHPALRAELRGERAA